MLNAFINIVKECKYYLISAVCILALICSTLYFAHAYHNEQIRANENIIALTDSIKYYKGKNGKLVAEKTILQGDMSTLKLANEDLYNKVKNMKVSNPQQVVHVESVIEHEKHDTLWSVRVDTITQSLQKQFAFNDLYRVLEGTVALSDTTLGVSINKDLVFVDYTLAIKDGKVYLQSDNPYVRYNEIHGITLPKQKTKHFGIGPSLGYGYDFVNHRFSPYVGISVNYNLITF